MYNITALHVLMCIQKHLRLNIY